MTALPGTPLEGPAAGDLIDGRYRLVDVLGRGHSAVVWRARDERLRRTVALKVFWRGNVVADQQASLKVMARFSHPNVVSMYDGGTATQADGSVLTFLVTELVDGQNLQQRLRAGTLTEVDAARVGLAIAHGLAHLHAQQVIHRNLKPTNVLIPRADAAELTAVAKLSDVGVASAERASLLPKTDRATDTARYLSPEQVSSANVTAQSDVYSLGVLLTEMLVSAGVLQPAGPGQRQRPRPVPSLGRSWTDLLHAMVAEEPDERPTLVQVVHSLGPLAARSAAVLPGVPPAALLASTVQCTPEPAASIQRARRRRTADRPALLGHRLTGATILGTVLLAGTIASLTTLSPPPADAGGTPGGRISRLEQPDSSSAVLDRPTAGASSPGPVTSTRTSTSARKPR